MYNYINVSLQSSNTPNADCVLQVRSEAGYFEREQGGPRCPAASRTPNLGPAEERPLQERAEGRLVQASFQLPRSDAEQVRTKEL